MVLIFRCSSAVFYGQQQIYSAVTLLYSPASFVLAPAEAFGHGITVQKSGTYHTT